MYRGIDDLIAEAEKAGMARRLISILGKLIEHPSLKKWANENEFIRINTKELKSMVYSDEVDKFESIEPVEVKVD
jgi:hypothetical protein